MFDWVVRLDCNSLCHVIIKWLYSFSPFPWSFSPFLTWLTYRKQLHVDSCVVTIGLCGKSRKNTSHNKHKELTKIKSLKCETVLQQVSKNDTKKPTKISRALLFEKKHESWCKNYQMSVVKWEKLAYYCSPHFKFWQKESERDVITWVSHQISWGIHTLYIVIHSYNFIKSWIVLHIHIHPKKEP